MMGKYVHKGVEIDLVGVCRELKEVHLFEVKWSDLGRNDVLSVINSLRDKAWTLPRSLSSYKLVLHVIARRYLGGIKEIPNTYLHNIDEVIELT